MTLYIVHILDQWILHTMLFMCLCPYISSILTMWFLCFASVNVLQQGAGTYWIDHTYKYTMLQRGVAAGRWWRHDVPEDVSVRPIILFKVFIKKLSEGNVNSTCTMYLLWQQNVFLNYFLLSSFQIPAESIPSVYFTPILTSIKWMT